MGSCVVGGLESVWPAFVKMTRARQRCYLCFAVCSCSHVFNQVRFYCSNGPSNAAGPWRPTVSEWKNAKRRESLYRQGKSTTPEDNLTVSFFFFFFFYDFDFTLVLCEEDGMRKLVKHRGPAAGGCERRPGRLGELLLPRFSLLTPRRRSQNTSLYSTPGGK